MDTKPLHNRIYFWIIPILIIIADQISKIYINTSLFYQQRVNIIPHFFDITLVYNPGAAFSFLANQAGWQKYFFTLLAFFISAYLIYAIIKKHFGTLGSVGAIFVVGGAIGNVIDRFLHGHVIDFILFYYNNYFYPAFNLADCFICLGAILIVIDEFKRKKETTT